MPSSFQENLFPRRHFSWVSALWMEEHVKLKGISNRDVQQKYNFPFNTKSTVLCFLPKAQRLETSSSRVTCTLKRAKSMKSDIYLPQQKSFRFHQGQWDSEAAVKNSWNLFPSKATQPYCYRTEVQPGSMQLAIHLASSSEHVNQSH